MRYFQVQAQLGKERVTFEDKYCSEEAALAFINRIRKSKPDYIILEMDLSEIDTTVVVFAEKKRKGDK